MSELRRWAPLTKKYLAVQDTLVFARRDEGIAGHGGKPVDESLRAVYHEFQDEIHAKVPRNKIYGELS